jgi:formylglycine-generating enzyme required for sulfatase activity
MPVSAQNRKNMVWVPGGTFRIGSDTHYAEEAPAHQVAVDGFWIDVAPVTNLQFARFVTVTGYVTMAERSPDPADYPDADPQQLVPASVVFRQPDRPVDLRNHLNWWALVPGANWRHPEGPGSTLHGRDRHPVVHVGFADACAYAEWLGMTLPTEAEWEYAAWGGNECAEYAWGDEFTPRGRFQANTWQGEFPWQNLESDGYARTSPVGAFPPNGYGLLDMIGNVWEWTTDWYQPHGEVVSACCGAPLDNPSGGQEALSLDPRESHVKIPRRVMKGGSHLCAPNYCRRYRPPARMAQPVDTATSHLGFRCIVRPA